MTKCHVTAQAFNRNNGMVAGVARTETIDLVKNRLFTGCKTILDVKKAYESFWNDMNPDSEEIVFVQEIVPVK